MNIGATLTLPIGFGAAGSGTRIWLAAGVTDMRKGFDGLVSIVQSQLSESSAETVFTTFVFNKKLPNRQPWCVLKRSSHDKNHWQQSYRAKPNPLA